MMNTIKHLGIVENIDGSHLRVRIVQTSACATCSIKGHCTSADTKEKIIDVTDKNADSYRPGDSVWVVGGLSMGAMAVWWAFVLPFVVVVGALFTFMALWGNELYAALCALGMLVPYYYMLWLNRGRMKKRFTFSIERGGDNAPFGSEN